MQDRKLSLYIEGRKAKSLQKSIMHGPMTQLMDGHILSCVALSLLKTIKPAASTGATQLGSSDYLVSSDVCGLVLGRGVYD